MKKLFPLLACLLYCMAAAAQPVKFYPSITPKILNGNNDTILNPFAGGLISPQFSNIDMNFDGVQDLLVFDASGNQILPFINDDPSADLAFRYAPDYADLFPAGRHFVLLADYNNDNLPDFFTYSPLGGLEIWKNTSHNKTLSFELRTDQLLFPHNGSLTNIFIGNSDIPALADVDGDGRLDILSFDVFGAYIRYFRNVSLNLDSLKFCAYDECFGKWLDSSGVILLGISCGPRKASCDTLRLENPEHKIVAEANKKHGGGGALLALDMDADNDLDLVIGDLDFTNLTLFTNGTKEYNNGGLDTFISFDTLFPAGTVPVHIPELPAAFYVDVDNDGIRDLISAPVAQSVSKKLNQVWLYKNKGQNNKPNFVFTKNNFLQDQMLDLGSDNAPAFIDYDGDGDLDLVVATAGDYVVNFDQADRLVLFENYDSDTFAIFKIKDNDYLSLQQFNYSGLRPAFGDLNGDGALDLLLGTKFGNLIYYENTSAPGKKINLTFKTDNYHNLKTIGTLTSPCIYDLNSDGKNDLIIGEARGNINYYQNNGTASNPSYTLITDTLGKIRTNSYFYSPIKWDADGNPTDSEIVMESTGASAPIVADFNGDGTPELVSGSAFNKIFFFEVQQDPNSKWPEFDTVFHNYVLKHGVNKRLGFTTTVAAASINSDSLPDLMVGTERGGLMFYSSMDQGPDYSVRMAIGSRPVPSLPVQVFPNPANDELYVSIGNPSSASEYTAEMIGLTGQTIFKTSLKKGNSSTIIPTADLPRGIYVLKIMDTKNPMNYAIKKVLLQ